eukprot:3557584-Prymnesium_polylepis.1
MGDCCLPPVASALAGRGLLLVPPSLLAGPRLPPVPPGLAELHLPPAPYQPRQSTKPAPLLLGAQRSATWACACAPSVHDWALAAAG